MNIMFSKAATGGIFYVIEKQVNVLQVLTFLPYITTKNQFLKNPPVAAF